MRKKSTIFKCAKVGKANKIKGFSVYPFGVSAQKVYKNSRRSVYKNSRCGIQKLAMWYTKTRDNLCGKNVYLWPVIPLK